MNLAPRLHRWIQPGGCILSGFGPRYTETVLSTYGRFGWRQANLYCEGDWVALLQWIPLMRYSLRIRDTVQLLKLSYD